MNLNMVRKNRSSKALISLLASLIIVVSLAASVSLVAADNPDFAISGNPASLCVNPAINARSLISVSSVHGFVGTIDLSDQSSPSNGVVLSTIPSTVTLANGQTVSFNLDMYTTPSTPLYVYTILVQGFSGGVFHQATITLTVSSDCSVGGVIVPTAFNSAGSYVMATIAIAGVMGVAVAGLVVYRSRGKSCTKP